MWVGGDSPPARTGAKMSDSTASMMETRATVYRLLSACYYEPEDCFLEEGVYSQLRDALNVLNCDLAPVAEKMGANFSTVGEDALVQDFSQLFMGPFEIPAKPYGSVYIDGENVVMGDSTMAVKACYVEAGFEVAESFRELPDHITVELEFLYLLSFRQAEAISLDDSEALARYKNIEKAFLGNHIGCWLGDFCAKIRQHAQTDYYRDLADLTEQFVLPRVD
jgi:putative dimethyl sulfoxide reductase chaperone